MAMFLSFRINGEMSCLKNRHFAEGCRNKGKNRDVQKLSAELSTGPVDGIFLVIGVVSMQRIRESGIEGL